jgi:hypothetical protein
MKIIKYILIGVFTLSLSSLNGDDWSLEINSINFDSSIPGDMIVMGVCEDCHDGFHYNEDETDLPPGPIPMTNIQFKNPGWIGQEDSNGNVCEYTSFYSDYKSVHEPSDLLIWKITGSCPESVQESSNMFQFSWVVDTLAQEYEIYMYTGENGIDMRYTTSTSISCELLTPTWNLIDGEWVTVTPSIRILIGGCASTGLDTFYLDNDGDGLGSQASSEFCAGYQPIEWVNNNTDLDDSIFCESNNFDTCWVCDGNDINLDCADICSPGTPTGESQEEEGYIYGAFIDDCGVCSGGSTSNEPNSDQDCAGECFGDAFEDDCGICSGGSTSHEPNSDQDCAGECFGEGFFDYCDECNGYNQSCLDLVFGYGPSDFYAQIDVEAAQIHLTWAYDDINISNQILGYKIYQEVDSNLSLITSIESSNIFSYSIDNYSEGIFCISVFDLYSNETNPICSEASEFSNFIFTLADGANLISFPYLSNEDPSVETIFNSLTDNVDGIISEGIASSYNSFLDMWQGTVQEIERRKGYWAKINLDEDQNYIHFSVSGVPTNPNTVYTLHDGANLISYVGPDSLSVEAAIPNNIEGLVEAIIGEGVAATPNPVLGWVGSLDEFILGKGYWVKMNPDIDDIDMIWNSDNLRSTSNLSQETKFSTDFNFNQSTLQAFYFVKNIIASSFILDKEDIIISYCNNQIVGSRYYSGDYTDIPAMGEDGERTIGYCQEGSPPSFKILDSETGKMLDLSSSDIPAWTNLGVFVINLEETQGVLYPAETQIVSVYPNPFNPAATIKFEIDKVQNINFSIFSIDGRLIDIIIDQEMERGIHSITWDSKNNPSGIYIMRLTSEESTCSTKALLVK